MDECYVYIFFPQFFFLENSQVGFKVFMKKKYTGTTRKTVEYIHHHHESYKKESSLLHQDSLQSPKPLVTMETGELAQVFGTLPTTLET